VQLLFTLIYDALLHYVKWQYTVFQKNGHPFYFFHNSLK